MLITTTEIKKEQRDTALIEALTCLWENSVRASHHFLTEVDIANLKPYVKEALQAIDTLLIAREGQEYAAFCGIQDGKIEMLFAAPEFFGKGIGRQLVGIAVKDYGATLVDVNEQNPEAFAFYRHMGFTVTGRDEKDGLGLPFPILHLCLHVQHTPMTALPHENDEPVILCELVEK